MIIIHDNRGSTTRSQVIFYFFFNISLTTWSRLFYTEERSGKETLEQGDDGRGSKRGRVLSPRVFFHSFFLLTFGYCVVCHHHRDTRPPTTTNSLRNSRGFCFFFYSFIFFCSTLIFIHLPLDYCVRRWRRRATTTPTHNTKTRNGDAQRDVSQAPGFFFFCACSTNV